MLCGIILVYNTFRQFYFKVKSIIITKKSSRMQSSTYLNTNENNANLLKTFTSQMHCIHNSYNACLLVDKHSLVFLTLTISKRSIDE